jgi:hypothetical protein
MVVDEDSRLKAAMMRQNLREIDARMAAIQADQRLFRRYRFDSDVQDMELTGLRAERADLVGRLNGIRPASRPNHSRFPGIRSYLLLPIALGVLALRALRPSAQKTRARYAPASSLNPVRHRSGP